MFALGLTALGLLVGGWLLYPAGLWLVSRRRSREAGRPITGAEPDVEVIIATRDAPEAIQARLRNILGSAYPPERLRVTVALDASAAASHAALRDALLSMHQVQVVLGDPAGGKAAALNAGVRAARAGVLVFTDTAQAFDPGTTAALVRCLQAPGVAGASGYLAARGDRGALGRFWAYETSLRALESRCDGLVGLTGAVYALRATAWVPLRDGLINDDLMVPLLVRRGGNRVVHCPDAVARDPREFTREQQYARRVRTLTGIYQLLAWHPWVVVPGRNPLWLEFLCHKVIRLLTPLLLVMAGLAIVPFLSAGVLIAIVGAALVVAVLGAILLRCGPAVLLGEAAWALRLLFVAPTVAAWHGLRGQWDVWGASVQRGAAGR